MNPFTLLTKGHTILGLENRPGTYKVLERSAFPNFSGPKRLAPTTPHPEPESTQPVFFAEPPPKVETPAPVSAPPAPAPAPDQALAKDQPSKATLWSRLARRPGAWLLGWIPRRKPSPLQSAPVQAELVLDKVKVIRNDLNEDDVEVVMIGKETETKTEKPAQSEKVERENLTVNP